MNNNPVLPKSLAVLRGIIIALLALISVGVFLSYFLYIYSLIQPGTAVSYLMNIFFDVADMYDSILTICPLLYDFLLILSFIMFTAKKRTVAAYILTVVMALELLASIYIFTFFVSLDIAGITVYYAVKAVLRLVIFVALIIYVTKFRKIYKENKN